MSIAINVLFLSFSWFNVVEEEDVDADASIQHTTTKEEDMAALQNMMLQINGGKDQDIQETRKLMTTVQELGKVTVDSLGLHPKNENNNDKDDDNSAFKDVDLYHN